MNSKRIKLLLSHFLSLFCSMKRLTNSLIRLEDNSLTFYACRNSIHTKLLLQFVYSDIFYPNQPTLTNTMLFTNVKASFVYKRSS